MANVMASNIPSNSFMRQQEPMKRTASVTSPAPQTSVGNVSTAPSGASSVSTGYKNPFMGAIGVNNQQQVQMAHNPTYDKSLYEQSARGLQNIGMGGGAGNPSLYQGWLNQQANMQPAKSATEGLLGIAQKGSPQVEKASGEIERLQRTQSDLANNPNTAANVAYGRSQGMATQIQAAQGKLSNILTGQGQQITAGQAAGNMALGGQAQQADIAQASAGLGLTQQGQQMSALGSAGTLTAPRQSGYVLLDPTTGQPVGGQGGAQGAAFTGGQIGAAENMGATYAEQGATLTALTGSPDGTGGGGMVSDFNTGLQQLGTNAGSINLGNALQQGLNLNTSGQYAALQTTFQNILAQYAKVLGPQAVNSLLSSSQNTTIAQFFDSLTKQAQQVRESGKAVVSGQSAPTSNNSGGNSIWNF